MKGRRWHASTCNSNLSIGPEQSSNFRGVPLECKLFEPLKLQATRIDRRSNHSDVVQYQKTRHGKLATG